MTPIFFLTAFASILSISLALPIEVVNVDPSTQDLQADASKLVLSKEQIVQLLSVDDDNIQENEVLDTAETAHHSSEESDSDEHDRFRGGYGGFRGGYGGYGGGYGGFGGGYHGGYGGGHHGHYYG